MTKHSFHVAGKLMLSGEWSILTPGHSCITLPTRGINVSIEPAAESCITSPAYSLERYPLAQLEQDTSATAQFLRIVFAEVFKQLGTALVLRDGSSILLRMSGEESSSLQPLINNTYNPYPEKLNPPLILRSLNDPLILSLSKDSKDKSGILPFHLTLENAPRTYIVRDGTTHKLGIGSSACTVVGITKAIALFHGIELDTITLFNIAAAAHSKAQGNVGSGFDIAAAASGAPILYTNRSAAHATDYHITPISLPTDWHIAVGFSGTSASTTNLIKIFNETRQDQPEAVRALMEQIEVCVQALARVIENTASLKEEWILKQVQDDKTSPDTPLGHPEFISGSILTKNTILTAMALINRNQELLTQLSALCNNALETPLLTVMIKIAAACGAATKFSGAGGGDCVIALCPDKETKQKVYADWLAAGFCPTEELLLDNEASTTK